MILTKIFYDCDNFMKEFEEEYNKKFIEDENSKSKYNSRLTMSEIMTILIYFHNSGYRTFKDYYIKYVYKNLKSAFPNIVKYTRFVELIPSVFIPLIVFAKTREIKSDNISFIDSTKIAVCKNQRIKQNRVFKDIAEVGKSTMGWFFGFKLHLIINEKGEVVSFTITQGNVDDRNMDVMNILTQNVSGKLFGDKGYISAKLFEYLKDKGVHLVTSIKKNMKNKLMPMLDKILLRKRSLIETVNDELKNMCDIEHSRHRSPINFFINLISGIVRYTYFDKKPSLKFSEKDRELLNGAIINTYENKLMVLV